MNFLACPSCQHQAVPWYRKLLPGFTTQYWGFRYQCEHCGAELTVGFLSRVFAFSPLAIAFAYLFFTESGKQVILSGQQHYYLLLAGGALLVLYLFGTRFTKS